VFHIILPALCVGMGVLSFFTGLTRRTLRSLGYVVILIGLFILVWSVRKKADQNKKRAVSRSIIGSSIAIVLAVIVHLIDPARDIFYYAAAAVVMVSVFASLISVVRQYNRLATHPDPHFYEKGGVS
jgi:FtsH-binding integral membrane protein